MINIRPIIKPINHQEIRDYEDTSDIRNVYDEYVSLLTKQGKDMSYINNAWVNNFGVIPQGEPAPVYECHLYSNNAKIVLTVLKRDDSDGGRMFEVVKLNKVIIDSVDESRKITITKTGVIVDKKKKEYIENDQNKEVYNFNYEDTWFTNLYIEDILNELKIKIKPYEYDDSNLNNIKPMPTLYINSMNYMESCDFSFVNDDFKEKLYDKIDKYFKEKILN